MIRTTLRFNTRTDRLLEIRQSILMTYDVNTRACRILRPNDTTRLSTTEANATSATDLLAYAGLLRLSASVRNVNRCLSRLTRVCALVDSVMRSNLITVTLVLRITSFRLRTRILNCLATLSRNIIFTTLNFLYLIRIRLLNGSMSTLSIVLQLRIYLLSLRFCRSTNWYCCARIIAQIDLCDRSITLLRIRIIGVIVVSLSNVFGLRFRRINTLDIS